MKTMGLSRLLLVQPEAPFPSGEAVARASGADDVLQQARVCASLDEALQGCRYVIGASARLRSLPMPLLAPREAGGKVVQEAAGGEVAVIFGRENSGLQNAELARCHALLHIPTNPDYSSLNLAAAVQVLAYEVRMAGSQPVPVAETAEPPASAEALEAYFRHLAQVLGAMEFLNPQNPDQVMHKLRRLYNRARPTDNEVSILRGILGRMEYYLKQLNR